jgi:single-strand DNA-binding protein
MIKMTAIGHLGSQATLNNVNGKQVINMNLAHSEKYKDLQGNIVNKSVWINVSWWSESSKILQYLQKGAQIFVEGIPSVDVYKNKDGQTVPQLKLRATMVQLLGSINRQDNPQPQQPASGLTASQEEFLAQDDSGLPF